MCSISTYKRHRKSARLTHYTRQLANIATVRFVTQDSPAESFKDVKRELVSEPVKLESISTALVCTASMFCTICQHDHMGSECVSPLNCSCVFGRDCFQPLLNRDTPSSYTCPNCRTRLHEPLEWKLVESNDFFGTSVRLPWDLRANIKSLQDEVMSDPKPFPLRRQVVRLFDRFNVFAR
jgi:hypothetical protein